MTPFSSWLEIHLFVVGLAIAITAIQLVRWDQRALAGVVVASSVVAANVNWALFSWHAHPWYLFGGVALAFVVMHVVTALVVVALEYTSRGQERTPLEYGA